VEQAGFEAVFVSGSAVAAALLGVPDLGLMSMAEVLGQTRNIVRAVGIPVIADCDNGYGNPINVTRTVQEFEAAGVAGLFIEDQVAPKRCGHFAGKQIVSCVEMVRKIEAAVEARRDADLLLIARTDAGALEGLDGAFKRARAYVQAGAEMVFVEAPESLAELRAIGRELATIPLMVNMVEGGKTPLLAVADLAELGFKLITFSGSVQKVAIHAVQGLLRELRQNGSVDCWYPDRMVSLDQRSAVLGLAEYSELEGRLLATED